MIRLLPRSLFGRTLLVLAAGLLLAQAASVAVNVLEHVKEDVESIRRLSDLVRPGGRLVLLVPAMPALYGKLDEELAEPAKHHADGRAHDGFRHVRPEQEHRTDDHHVQHDR